MSSFLDVRDRLGECGGRAWHEDWLRTIGARALYRATLRDDLPEYVFLVGIPFYLDLRGKEEMMDKVSIDPCVPELTE